MCSHVATNTKWQNVMFPSEMIKNASKDIAQYLRYKEILQDYVNSLTGLGKVKYNDSEKWKTISEAYADVK